MHRAAAYVHVDPGGCVGINVNKKNINQVLTLT